MPHDVTVDAGASSRAAASSVGVAVAACEHGVDGGAEDAGLLDFRHRVEQPHRLDRMRRLHLEDRRGRRRSRFSSSIVPSAASVPAWMIAMRWQCSASSR